MCERMCMRARARVCVCLATQLSKRVELSTLSSEPLMMARGVQREMREGGR
jgi:hypothetical protein